MVTRSWVCQNKYCGIEFDAQRDNPPCPQCGCLRTQWLPKPIALRSTSTNKTDNLTRQLADEFKLSNIRPPRRGEAQKQQPAQPGRTVKIGGIDAPLDRVTSFKTGAKVGGNLGLNLGGNTAPLRAATTLVAKADK